LITVTEEAKALLRTADSPEGAVLRLDPVGLDQATEEVRLGLAPGEPKGDDQVVQHDGEEVLRIGWFVSELLNGSTIDVVVEAQQDGARGPRVGLGIRSPGPEPLTDDS
jgi:iron-sulfur cluster assembly protein